MKTNVEVTKTNLSGMETNFDNLKLCVLNEKEMNEINGGGYYKMIDEKMVWVAED